MKLKTLLDQISGDNRIHLKNWKTNERDKEFMNHLRFECLTVEELNAPVLILDGIDYKELYISIFEKEDQ